MRTIQFRIAMMTISAISLMTRWGIADPLTVDFRYRPSTWQSLICMPCDAVKTLVGKDGTLFNADAIKLIPLPAANAGWVSQELAAPRVPIVLTHCRAGDLEISEEAFVSPIAADAARVKSPFVQRIGNRSTINNWASPTLPCEPAFRDAATVYKEPVHYRFRSDKDQVYTVVLGFCEGANNKPGDRIVNIEIEARHRRRLDLAKEFGRNVPALIPLEARDENGDGMIDLDITPDNDCHDPYSLLNVLWVFKGKPSLNLNELQQGRSSVPSLAHVAGGANSDRQLLSPSVNVVLVRLHNAGKAAITTAPEFMVESPDAAKPHGKDVAFGRWTVTGTEPFADVKVEKGKATLHFSPKSLAAGEDRVLAMSLWREALPAEVPRRSEEAVALRKSAERYWKQLDLPYDCLQIPDQGVQNLIEASLRGIAQNRDYKNGVPVYQVGPTGYRDISCADGSFMCEVAILLGRAKDASDTLDYFLAFQRADGRLWLYRDFWKENGLVTWDLVRYAELTDDTAWLEKRWKHVEGMVGFIQELRRRAMQNPKALNYGLIPDGFGDGGTDGSCAEYSNVVWNMAGLRAAITGAKLLGKNEQAAAWQKEFEDMSRYFRKAIARDERRDKHGNLYLPNLMGSDGSVPPPQGQWAFMHSIFPGKLYARNDPLVQGSLAMLEAVQIEGLPLGSGWAADGVWPYFSHFQANAALWNGQGQKTGPLLYAIANHAAPVLNWCEEQSLHGQGTQVRGDMPHNWGSAEFIRQVRYMLVLERGQELHLFEGLPSQWTQPGMVTRIKDVLTEFGPISLALDIASDGKQASLKMDLKQRIRPTKVVLHLDGWSGRSGTIELPADGHVERTIELRRD
ncbi:MAG: hypothetical protein WCB27_12475 [Thermoguttaceae bacterium]